MPQDQRPSKATIADGAVVPACAQACPAGAIVFGDRNDANSKVAQMHRHDRSYELLEEINTKPRNKYLARLENPNPTLSPAPAVTPAHGDTEGHG
jgi:molybdopterin-containing oxidoreductase family iron-sulfur binding subunit